ncbi:hypothetical protein LTR33_003003 [Friedmanniomyces endolithicus]|nr:hypothetical protein LTR33_003003 [Friedmanniomyces endolithicus]
MANFRNKILSCATSEEAQWPAWTEAKGEALMVSNPGVKVVGKDEYMAEWFRRGTWLALAEKDPGKDGFDVLWSDVCRRFLTKASEYFAEASAPIPACPLNFQHHRDEAVGSLEQVGYIRQHALHAVRSRVESPCWGSVLAIAATCMGSGYMNAVH